MTQEYSNYLAHHGVKGQKWGVRRYQNEDGTLKHPKGRPESSTWKAKDAGELSDEELDRRNRRLQRENNYRKNVDNAHGVTKEFKEKAAQIFVTSAAVALAGIMTKKYEKAASFVIKNAPKAFNFVKSKVATKVASLGAAAKLGSSIRKIKF